MEKILTQEELNPSVECANRLLEELDRILLGHHEVHKLVLVGILSRGHILLEGLPGVGKTALVKALGELMSLEFKRIQFTPDLLPGDILGGSILQVTDDGERRLEFQPGPIFSNIVLADEINRSSPKTQSAMLEAMQERSVTLLGVTRKLPEPFFVLASQNPIELEGTYPIPEAQLDRFMFKIDVGGVDADVLTRIITERRRGEPPQGEWHLSRGELDMMYDAIERIALSPAVANYIARLVAAGHPGSASELPEVTKYLAYGASPRAAIAMAEAARGAALLAGRPTVGFEDVKAVAPSVLNHRLILNYQAKLAKVTSFDLVDILLEKVDEAGMKLPEGVTVSAN